MALPNIFKGVSGPRTLTVSFLALATAASAQAQSNDTSIDFIGRSVDCSTLQGKNDPIPGGLTCSFVEEVEQYISGPALRCDPNLEDHSRQALQQAALHMDIGHKQPAILAYTETKNAAFIAAANKTGVMQELRAIHPDRAEDFAATYSAIENLLRGLKRGSSFETSLNYAASRLDARGLELPESTGSTVEDIRNMLNKNPVSAAYIKCSATYEDLNW